MLNGTLVRCKSVPKSPNASALWTDKYKGFQCLSQKYSCITLWHREDQVWGSLQRKPILGPSQLFKNDHPLEILKRLSVRSRISSALISAMCYFALGVNQMWIITSESRAKSLFLSILRKPLGTTKCDESVCGPNMPPFKSPRQSFLYISSADNIWVHSTVTLSPFGPRFRGYSAFRVFLRWGLIR